MPKQKTGRAVEPVADIHLRARARAWVAEARTLAHLPSSTAGGSPAAKKADTLGNEAMVILAEPIGFEPPGGYPARLRVPFGSRAMELSEPALHPGQPLGRRAAVTAGEQITQHCAG